ncbi:MAG TPA: hypothetical protein VHX12_00580, partial [Acidisoma sp.]|nr:hypothetical protein [Acidisoma sp.]
MIDDLGKTADGLGKRVDRSGKKVDQAAESAGKAYASRAIGIARFIENILRPDALLRQHLEGVAKAAKPAQTNLEEVGAQGRRTGAGVEAGALAGASGLTRLAGAGLIAYAALKTVSGVIETLSKSADVTVAMGVNAGSAGLPIRRFGGIVNALAGTGLTTPEDAGVGLVNFKQAIESLNSPHPNSAMIADMAYLHLTPDMTPDEMYRSLALRFSKESKADVTRDATIGHLPVGAAQALRKLGPNYDKAVAQGELTAPTPDDVKAGEAYRATVTKISQAWDQLTREVVTDIEGPLVSALNALRRAINDLAHPGETAKRWWEETKNNPNPLDEFANSPDAPKNFQNSPAMRFWRWLTGRGASAGSDAAASPRGAPTGPIDAGPGNWEVQHNNFAGMRRTDVPAAGPNQGGFQSFATPAAGVAAIEHQLDRYYQGKTTHSPLTTLRSMISEWAPPNENDTAALIARAVRVVGVGADQALNWSDPATRAKVIEAFIRNEQGGKLPAAAAAALYGQPKAPVAPAEQLHTVIGRDGKPYTLGPKDYATYLQSLPPKPTTVTGPDGKQYPLSGADAAAEGRAYDAGDATWDAWFKAYKARAGTGKQSMLEETPGASYLR